MSNNQPTQPPTQPSQPTTNLLTSLQNHPLYQKTRSFIIPLFTKFKQFFTRYVKHIFITITALATLTTAFFLARPLFKPNQVPAPAPTPTVTQPALPEPTYNSELTKLRQQLNHYSISLPDPAVPELNTSLLIER